MPVDADLAVVAIPIHVRDVTVRVTRTRVLSISIRITRDLLQSLLSYLAVASSVLSQRLMGAHAHETWIGSFVFENCGKPISADYGPVVVAENYYMQNSPPSRAGWRSKNARIQDPRLKCYETTARARR